MEIRVYASIPIDKSFEEYIRNKFARLDKFIFKDGTIELNINKEGPFYVSKANINSGQHNLFIREENNDLNKSIENLFDRTKRQVRKLHDKIVDRPHRQ